MQNRAVFAFEAEFVFPAVEDGRGRDDKDVSSFRKAVLNPSDRHDGLTEAHPHEERDLVASANVFPGFRLMREKGPIHTSILKWSASRTCETRPCPDQNP